MRTIDVSYSKNVHLENDRVRLREENPIEKKMRERERERE